MRFSTIKTHKEKGQALNAWTFEKFIESIQVDVNKSIISDFRRSLNIEHPERFYRFDQIAQVSAAVELKKQENGAISVKAFNGLVVLEVRGLMSPEQCRSVKLAAMETEATLAAFIGATGQEVIILVKVAQPDGSLPTTEADAEDFYARAYHRMARIYDATLPKKVTRIAPSMRHMFLRPFDMEPEVNTNARPYPIRPDSGSNKANLDDHLLSQPEQRQEEEEDLTAYMNYERAYERVAREVADKSGCSPRYGNEFYKNFITGMATALCRQGWPQEEVICHLWIHLKYKDWPGLTEQFARTIVDAVYAEEEKHPRVGRRHQAPEEPMMQELIRRLESHYAFRFNTIMGYTEYRPKHTWPTPWQPLTDKAVNTLTTDLQLAGMKVWNRDVRRYVHSTRIQEHNPIEDYLLPLEAQWDKRDHIRALAATVPTTEPELWAEWFHTWFLAMVAQWLGRDPRYGNSIVPLLISPQGMHKSAFCRQLLPPELRGWGYTDNLSLAEERPVHLAMAQMLLINLDEFNRISPQKQQGFLKNIIQLPSVKVKRPYATHTEEVPRLASFIATTNIADALADPTGSRRFVGVEVKGDIDVSQTPNYVQLYAQAMSELRAGARYWFNEAETAAVMDHNRQFQQLSPSAQFFLDFFEACDPSATDAQWLTTTELMRAIKKQAGSTYTPPSAIQFGRTIREIQDMQHRRSKYGEQYCVRAKGGEE